MTKKTKPKRNPLMDRVLQTSTLETASVLSESEFFGIKESVPLPVPALNIAMSGDIDGGLYHGLHMIAGESKTFKTLMGLVMMKAYLDYYEDAIAIFYDSEFGSTDSYLQAIGIDPTRVVHVPLNNLEELKFDVVKQLDSLQKGDRVFFFVDSVGNIASKKELEDALKASDKSDMTRAKQLKSLYRMVTPYLTTRNVPMVIINHIYMTQEMFAQVVVSGGSGGIYSSNSIWVVSKRQIKKGEGADKELIGHDFIITINKSRMVKEKSRIPLTVVFDGGISAYSGLLDIAKELGYVGKAGKDKLVRQFLDAETGELVAEETEWSAKETNSAEFWQPIFEKTDFKEQVKNMYQLGKGGLLVKTETAFEEAEPA